MQSLRSLSLALLCAMTVRGEAVVEYSAGTAGASAAETGVKGAGSAVGGVFGALTQTIEKSSITSVITPAPPKLVAASTSATQAVEPKPVVLTPIVLTPIDVAWVSVGLDRAELLKRCGDPPTLTSETKGTKFVETFSYTTTAHDVVDIKVTDGKVASITPTSSKKRSNVVVLN